MNIETTEATDQWAPSQTFVESADSSQPLSRNVQSMMLETYRQGRADESVNARISVAGNSDGERARNEAAIKELLAAAGFENITSETIGSNTTLTINDIKGANPLVRIAHGLGRTLDGANGTQTPAALGNEVIDGIEQQHLATNNLTPSEAGLSTIAVSTIGEQQAAVVEATLPRGPISMIREDAMSAQVNGGAASETITEVSVRDWGSQTRILNALQEQGLDAVLRTDTQDLKIKGADGEVTTTSETKVVITVNATADQVATVLADANMLPQHIAGEIAERAVAAHPDARATNAAIKAEASARVAANQNNENEAETESGEVEIETALKVEKVATDQKPTQAARLSDTSGDIVEEYRTSGNTMTTAYQSTGTDNGQVIDTQADSYRVISSQGALDIEGMERLLDGMANTSRDYIRDNVPAEHQSTVLATGALVNIAQVEAPTAEGATFNVLSGSRGDSYMSVVHVDAEGKVSLTDLVADAEIIKDEMGGRFAYDPTKGDMYDLGLPGLNTITTHTVTVKPGEQAFVISASDGAVDADGHYSRDKMLLEDIEHYLRANPENPDIARFLSERSAVIDGADNVTAVSTRLTADTNLNGDSITIATFDGSGKGANEDGKYITELSELLANDVEKHLENVRAPELVRQETIAHLGSEERASDIQRIRDMGVYNRLEVQKDIVRNQTWVASNAFVYDENGVATTGIARSEIYLDTLGADADPKKILSAAHSVGMWNAKIMDAEMPDGSTRPVIRIDEQHVLTTAESDTVLRKKLAELGVEPVSEAPAKNAPPAAAQSVDATAGLSELSRRAGEILDIAPVDTQIANAVALGIGDLETRDYHGTEDDKGHFFDVAKNGAEATPMLIAKGVDEKVAIRTGAIATLAGRDHDVAYVGPDGGLMEPVRQTTDQYIEKMENGNYRIRDDVKGENIRIAMEVYGYTPGQELNNGHGANEFISNLHSLEVNRGLTTMDKIALSAFIHETIPFEAPDSVEKLMQRIEKIDGFDPKLRDAIGLTSAHFANGDVANFGFELEKGVHDRKTFMSNTVALLNEGGTKFDIADMNDPNHISVKAGKQAGFFEFALLPYVANPYTEQQRAAIQADDTLSADEKAAKLADLKEPTKAIFRSYEAKDLIDPSTGKPAQLMTDAELQAKNEVAFKQMYNSVNDMKMIKAAAEVEIALAKGQDLSTLDQSVVSLAESGKERLAEAREAVALSQEKREQRVNATKAETAISAENVISLAEVKQRIAADTPAVNSDMPARTNPLAGNAGRVAQPEGMNPAFIPVGPSDGNAIRASATQDNVPQAANMQMGAAEGAPQLIRTSQLKMDTQELASDSALLAANANNGNVVTEVDAKPFVANMASTGAAPAMAAANDVEATNPKINYVESPLSKKEAAAEAAPAPVAANDAQVEAPAPAPAPVEVEAAAPAVKAEARITPANDGPSTVAPIRDTETGTRSNPLLAKAAAHTAHVQAAANTVEKHGGNLVSKGNYALGAANIVGDVLKGDWAEARKDSAALGANVAQDVLTDDKTAELAIKSLQKGAGMVGNEGAQKVLGALGTVVVEGLDIGGRKIPVVGAVVGLGFGLYETGSEIYKAVNGESNWKKVASTAASGVAGTVGGIFGFGGSEVLQEGVHYGSAAIFGKENAAKHSGTVELVLQANESFGIVDKLMVGLENVKENPVSYAAGAGMTLLPGGFLVVAAVSQYGDLNKDGKMDDKELAHLAEKTADMVKATAANVKGAIVGKFDQAVNAVGNALEEVANNPAAAVAKGVAIASLPGSAIVAAASAAGDLNKDGKIDLKDAAHLKEKTGEMVQTAKATIKSIPKQVFAAADLDRDGDVDAKDAQIAAARTTAAAKATAAKIFAKGDLDRDGDVDAADAKIAATRVAANAKAAAAKAFDMADTNNDGKLDFMEKAKFAAMGLKNAGAAVTEVASVAAQNVASAAGHQPRAAAAGRG